MHGRCLPKKRARERPEAAARTVPRPACAQVPSLTRLPQVELSQNQPDHMPSRANQWHLLPSQLGSRFWFTGPFSSSCPSSSIHPIPSHPRFFNFSLVISIFLDDAKLITHIFAPSQPRFLFPIVASPHRSFLPSFLVRKLVCLSWSRPPSLFSLSLRFIVNNQT